jgi:glycosyltransferase involved in cell wall biosynthesis
VPEIVEDGITGFIVDSIGSAAAAVSRSRQLDRASIRRRFDERFTSERMALDYLRIYDQVLGSRDFGAGGCRRAVQDAD